MKGTYTHTFSKARNDVDKKIDEFFEKKSQNKKDEEKESHFDGIELTEEEAKKLKEYAIFLKSQSQ